MKKLIIAVLAAIVAYVAFNQREQLSGIQLTASAPRASATPATEDVLARAFERRQSNVQIEGQGVVVRLLRDDDAGSRHQRFIVALASGQTVLISHNIDLAPRVSPLAAGDRVQFYGEYEWNEEGGVMHWTHHDPAGQHPGGWIRREGKAFR